MVLIKTLMKGIVMNKTHLFIMHRLFVRFHCGGFHSFSNTLFANNVLTILDNRKLSLVYSDRKHIKIYTKTGDKGKSSTFSGERLLKNNEVFKALGDLDELSCSIGLVIEHLLQSEQNDIAKELEKVQCQLQDIGSFVASHSNDLPKQSLSFGPKAVVDLESKIDIYTQQLPVLKNFILPSGGIAAASIHLSRALCRRAERSVVTMVQLKKVDIEASVFLNRLSDYLFTLARITAQQLGNKEKIYQRSDAPEK